MSMIAEAIIATGERGGVSRQAIWKYLVMKFPKATSNERGNKIFLARLKKFADNGKHNSIATSELNLPSEKLKD